MTDWRRHLKTEEEVKEVFLRRCKAENHEPTNKLFAEWKSGVEDYIRRLCIHLKGRHNA